MDVSTPSEAERAIQDLNGKTIMDRKVSVQLARKPEPAAAATTEGEGGEGQQRRRPSTRGRGRGRGGRSARGGRRQSAKAVDGETKAEPTTNGAPTNVPAQVVPLTDTTNEALTAEPGAEGTTTVDAKKDSKTHARQPRKQRGPPEDGVPSKTKIMVANLPYDLREEKVSLRRIHASCLHNADCLY